MRRGSLTLALWWLFLAVASSALLVRDVEQGDYIWSGVDAMVMAFCCVNFCTEALKINKE